MAHEIDGKDTRPDALEEGCPEEHLRLSEGTPLESAEKDKVDGFLNDIVRHARFALLNNSFAIFDKFAAMSIEGSIQHLKMLIGIAGVKEPSKPLARAKTLSEPFLTAKLFHEMIKFRSEPGPDGGDLKPAEPLEGQSEDEATDRFHKDAGSNS